MLRDRFVQDAVKLRVEALTSDMPGEVVEDIFTERVNSVESLVNAASHLAFSEDPFDRKLAYEIATSAVQLVPREQNATVFAAAYLILTRLGNFPGRRLLQNKFGQQDELPRLPIYLHLEEITRRVQNTITTPWQTQMELTDFQVDFLAATEDSSVSISAPTSAGKSHILILSVVQQVMQGNRPIIVYLVPTRALMRQVAQWLIRDLEASGRGYVPVRCVPVVDESVQSVGAVYILTQERLLTLLDADPSLPDLTTLIVDEAQGVADGARGVLLETAVTTAVARHPRARLLCVAPQIENPAYLLSTFRRRRRGYAWVERLSPVGQNVILVSGVSENPYHITLDLLTDWGRHSLGRRALPFRFASLGRVRRQAEFAYQITKAGDCTLIYANGPREAEEICEELVKFPWIALPITPEIQELIDFLRDHIHPSYPLIRFLQHRIAFHYGSMPGVVRERIEELVEAQQLTFVCCTSTLLQGVNLPAHHIVVDSPRLGRGNPMSAADFRNLAGRAGRLTVEFFGNVWCLQPRKWQTPSYDQQAKISVTSAFEAVVSDQGELITRYERYSLPREDAALAATAIGRLITDYLHPERSKNPVDLSATVDPSLLQALSDRCRSFQTELPYQLIRRNLGISPDRLQQLFSYLASSDNTALLPLHPYQEGAYERLRTIFQVTAEILGRDETGFYKLHTWLAWEWIRGTPLNEIIEKRIKRLQDTNRFKGVSHTVREIFHNLENEIRFKYVRFSRAYNDALAYVLPQEHEVAVRTLVPISQFLEYGASNDVALRLAALGLSRTTALALVQTKLFANLETPEEVLQAIKAIDIDSLRLPAVCKREVAHFRR